MANDADPRVADGLRQLREWMEEHGYSQQWLAEALDVNQSSVSGWLRAASRPEPHHRLTIRVLTGIPEPAWLTEAERDQAGKTIEKMVEKLGAALPDLEARAQPAVGGA